ncbi:hypothetical protein ACJRO7_010424 [Eucalyptus globulus]|uniref:Uncharacterized protein n=1 Tax=Eucalyptus globulus TaxID=34317 RepID=A0ABD3LBY5_EUCGL
MRGKKTGGESGIESADLKWCRHEAEGSGGFGGDFEGGIRSENFLVRKGGARVADERFRTGMEWHAAWGTLTDRRLERTGANRQTSSEIRREEIRIDDIH